MKAAWPCPFIYLRNIRTPPSCLVLRRAFILSRSRSGNRGSGCTACCGAGSRFSGAQPPLAALFWLSGWWSGCAGYTCGAGVLGRRLCPGKRRPGCDTGSPPTQPN
jgi:hypothetical protein